MQITKESTLKRIANLENELVSVEARRNEILGGLKECHAIISYLDLPEQSSAVGNTSDSGQNLNNGGS